MYKKKLIIHPFCVDIDDVHGQVSCPKFGFVCVVCVAILSPLDASLHLPVYVAHRPGIFRKNAVTGMFCFLFCSSTQPPFCGACLVAEGDQRSLSLVDGEVDLHVLTTKGLHS